MQRRFFYYLAAVLLLTVVCKLYVDQTGRISQIPIFPTRKDIDLLETTSESTKLNSSRISQIPIFLTRKTIDHLETTSKSTRLNSTWIFDNKDLKQNDSEILKYIRDYHLTPPSTKPLNVRVGNPSDYINELESLLGNKRNGFFIECGANDGEFLSNTLALEKDKNWTGLLIEANRFILPELRIKNRKAWIADVCLSLKPYPQKLKFLHRPGNEQWWYKGTGLIDQGKDNWSEASGNPKNYISAGIVDCFPLFSLLSAINVTRVDYMSLDIQGVEYKVLKTIPFYEVDIQVISVEYHMNPEGEQGIQDLMKSKGYRQVIKKGLELFFVKNP